MGENALQRTDLDHQILELRRAGYSYTDISRTLDVPAARARRVIKAAVEKAGDLNVEEADTIRTLDNDRLDTMLASVWPRAQQGDITAIHTVLRIMERRAKLLGLDLRPDVNVDQTSVIVLPPWAKGGGESPPVDRAGGDGVEVIDGEVAPD